MMAVTWGLNCRPPSATVTPPMMMGHSSVPFPAPEIRALPLWAKVRPLLARNVLSSRMSDAPVSRMSLAALPLTVVFR